MKVCGSIAYVSQQAFIINASIIENVTFGKDFNRELFDEAIEQSEMTEVRIVVWRGANCVCEPQYVYMILPNFLLLNVLTSLFLPPSRTFDNFPTAKGQR